MPRVVKDVLKSAIVGFAAAAVFVGLIMYFDLSGIRGLTLSSNAPIAVIALLYVFIGLTFSSVQAAVTIMNYGRNSR